MRRIQIGWSRISVAACLAPMAFAMVGCSTDRSVPIGDLVVERDTIADTIVVRNISGARWGNDARLVEELRIDGDAASFGQVSLLDVDLEGRIYLYDGMLRALHVYSGDGKFLRQLGRVGDGPGEFRNVLGLAVLADGRVAVRDAARVLVFTADGDAADAWTVGAGVMLPAPDALVADAKGGVFTVVPGGVGTQGAARVFRQKYAHIDSYGVLSDEIEQPIEPDLPPPLTPFSVRMLSTLSRDGAVVSAVSDRYEIQLSVTGIGNRRIVRVGEVPLTLVDGELKAHRVFMEEIASRNPGEPRVEVPRVKPLLRSLRMTRDGDLWVQRHAPAVVTLGAPRSGRPIEARDDWKEPEVWDVFDDEGEYMGRLELPLGARVLAMDNQYAWGTLLDENDVPSVVRWRIVPS